MLVTGLAPPSELGVFNNNLENGYRAVAERYLTCKVGEEFLPALGADIMDWIFDPHMIEFCEELNKNLKLAPVASLHEVVDTYKGVKRKLYLEAETKVLREGVTWKDAWLSMFAKFEKCNLAKACRVINPRSRTYNLALGRFLKKNEHAYFDALAKVFKQDKVVIKGMNINQQAEELKKMYDHFVNTIAIGGDATKFDMHVSIAALIFEHLCYVRPYCSSYYQAVKVYLQMMEWVNNHLGESMPANAPDLAQLTWLLVRQLQNHMQGWFDDGRIVCDMNGTRCSGDLNTSLGNCILMCAMTYGWHKTSGVDVNLANNGDDCQYFMEAEDEELWRNGFAEYYAKKGFRMELEPTAHEFEMVEFCQSKPVYTIEGWKMVRNPQTLVTKGSMCLLPVQNMKTLRKWMMGVGVAEGSLGRGVPVIQSFARALRRNGLRCSKRMIGRIYNQSTRMFHSDLRVEEMTITAEARVSFSVAWGISPDEQIALEKYYNGWQCSAQFGHVIPGYEARERVGVPHASEVNLVEPVY